MKGFLRIQNSDIENKGKEFDYYWRDMAERIIELEIEIETLESDIEEKERK